MSFTDEELIKKVAEKVMGWTWTITSPVGGTDYWSSESSIGDATTDFNPITNLNHAFIVVDRMRELGWECQIWSFKTDYRVVFYHGFREWRELKERHYTKRESIGHAICLAALKAVDNG